MGCDLSALAGLDASDPQATQELLQACTATLLDPALWLWALAFTVLGAVVGALIGRRNNAVARDLVLGAALGPIGWIISLLLPPRRPAPLCPACGKAIDPGDRHCRHCGAKI